MFLKAFRSNSPVSILILPVLTGVLWIHSFLYPVSFSNEHSMPFYEMPALWSGQFPLAASIVAYVFVMLTAFLYNYIVNEHEFLPKRTYLPGLFYCLLMSSAVSLLQIHPIIFANLFIILSLNALLKMYRKTKSLSGAFEAGFFLSIATLFYFPSVFLIPFLLVSLAILRPFIWREWTIVILGLLFPYIYIITYYYWNNKPDVLFEHKMAYYFINGKRNWAFFKSGNPVFWMLAGVLLLSLAVSVRNLAMQKLKTKKGYTLLFWSLPFCFLTILAAPDISVLSLSILTVPSAILFAHYFYSLKRLWIARLLLIAVYLTELVIIWGDKIYSP